MNGVLVRGGARGVVAASRAAQAPARRGLAAHADEPVVLFADYRAGKATLAEWVDANRHIVAGGMFAFYVSLAAIALRPKKKPAPAADIPVAAVDDVVPDPTATS
jgi:fermentation-respiration switch protein FrsA (DUF1100 family)